MEMVFARFAAILVLVWIITIALHIWCVVKVARSSGLYAAAVLFLPFANYFALFSYWGDDDSDIRKPMAYSHLLWLLTLIFLWTFGQKQIATLVALDQQASAAIAGSESADYPQYEGEARAVSKRYRELVGALKKEYGSVELKRIKATLNVPKHFRFISAESLTALGNEFDIGIDDETLGWLVHERIDLAASDSWHIEVHWDGQGFSSEADFATRPAKDFLAEAQRLSVKLSRRNAEAGMKQYSFMGLPSQPQWLASERIATWVEDLVWEGETEHTLDCYALRQARYGVLVFFIVDQPLTRQELCLSAVRLGARSIRFAPAQDVNERNPQRDRQSSYVLADYVTGRIGLPEK